MISEGETEEIKEKIISQIESAFPADRVLTARQQVESMSSEQLEKFLEKNKLIKTDDSKGGCVFCSIALDKIQSCKIDENKEAIAILEINPISRGHTLVIPKEHTSKTEKGMLDLVKKVSKTLKKKLKPKKVEISKSELFGHGTVNILPVYGNEDFNSEKKSAKMEELEKIKEELEKKQEKVSKPKTEKIKEILWLPKRIP